MIIKYVDYLIEGKEDIDLKYLALDFDDNILHMPTPIYMDHLVDVKLIPEKISTEKFAKVRNDSNWKTKSDSFVEFRDNGPRGKSAFVEDVKYSIKNKDFGPSWDKFIKYLTNGSIFAIITARGNSPQVLREGVEYIIDNYLSESQQDQLYTRCLIFSEVFSDIKYDKIRRGITSKTDLVSDYLDQCDFYGVSSDYFKNKFGKLGKSDQPEDGKKIALKAFAEKVNQFGKKSGIGKISLGFSDDDSGNVQHIQKLFSGELLSKYSDMNLFIYDTSNRGFEKNKVSRKVIDENQSTFGSGAQTWGTDSSVLPFTKWNNMTQNLYPNGKDEPTNDYHNQFKNQIGQLKDLTNINEIKKKKKIKKLLNKFKKTRKNNNI